MTGCAVPVFIHGWASSSRIWGPLIDRMGIDCMTLGLPGYGLEEDPGPADLPDPCVLVGWSLGGLWAIAQAASMPTRVKALVLVAASPCFVQRPDWPRAMPAGDLQRFTRALEEDREVCLRRFMALQCLGDKQAADVRARLRAALPDPLPGRRLLADGLAQLAGQDLRRELAALPCPVDIVLGERDGLIPADQARDLESLGEEIRVTVIPGAAHLPFVSDCAAFAKLLTRILAEND